MSIQFIKKTYVTLHVLMTDTNKVVCYPLPAVNPDNFNKNAVLDVINQLSACLQPTCSIQAVRKISGYKVR